jgi:endonuclease YncB( thermonuclease family)
VFRLAASNFRGVLFASATQTPTWAPLCLLALAGLFLFAPAAFAQSASAGDIVKGRAHIVDGDTLEIGTRRVHLYGVDAPEPEQKCERRGKPWRCGMEATFAMAALLETHWLTCEQRGTDTAGDMVAVCRMGAPLGPVVNEEIVRRGWALVLPPAHADYAAAEKQAKAAKLGIWSGSFVAPWEWRRTHETGKTIN